MTSNQARPEVSSQSNDLGPRTMTEESLACAVFASAVGALLAAFSNSQFRRVSVGVVTAIRSAYIYRWLTTGVGTTLVVDLADTATVGSAIAVSETASAAARLHRLDQVGRRVVSPITTSVSRWPVRLLGVAVLGVATTRLFFRPGELHLAVWLLVYTLGAIGLRVDRSWASLRDGVLGSLWSVFFTLPTHDGGGDEP